MVMVEHQTGTLLVSVVEGQRAVARIVGCARSGTNRCSLRASRAVSQQIAGRIKPHVGYVTCTFAFVVT